jgi:alpha-amylase/alpha-mannosidase (GH57 family)
VTADTVALLFGVHAHQPAGNFGEVVAHAHERCYAPFLRTLAEYPAFRFAVHASGTLIEALADRCPGDVELLGTMVARGQVELFGAGDSEPVLAAIPHRDRVSQIESLSAKLALRFGKVPHGAWLTERVWESSVVPALAQSGVRYAIVDDYHFLCTGCDARALDRYYTTEEDGATVDLFPISEALRYRIPFAPAADAVRHVESLAQPGRVAAAIYFDDIEKFGVWPGTHEWVYQRRWLRDFVERVLGSDRVRPMHYGDYHAATRTGGIVYLPSTSYVEMNAWTLPPPAAQDYSALADAAGRGERRAAQKGFVRGGTWRNFLTRYPEANWMHKRMLRLSERLARTDGASDDVELRALLHRAQANDAYWHGLFGGLYLPHLRRAVYASLLALEARLDALDPRAAPERGDVDFDGVDELFVRSRDVQVALRLDGTAAIRELDAYALAQNFGDTLRRHREHYHRLIAAGATHERHGAGIPSAHERVAFRHAIGSDEIAPDDTPRDIARDAWTGDAGTRAIDAYELRAIDRTSASFAAALAGGRIDKRVAVDGAAVVVTYDVRMEERGSLRTTLDLAMPSCDGFTGRYIVGDDIPCGFGQPLDIASADAVVLDDRCMGGAVVLRFTPAARVRGRPYHTVSQSENGFERIMQSATIDAQWSVGSPSASFHLRIEVVPDGEHAGAT